MNNFIEYLKEQIGNKSLGQIEVLTGVTKSYLSKILRGERSIPKPDTLKKLSKALSCTYEDLMREAGYLSLGTLDMARLKELRNEKHLTLKELGKEINLAESTLSLYENGLREPDFATLKKLADFFNVTIDYLLGRTCHLKNISSADLGNSFIKVPVYGEIPAGIPIEMIDTSYIEDYEDISTELLKGDKKAFCLKVKGESMMPKFEDGDVLVLIQQEDCNTGDYCAVSINHTECTFKKVIKHKNGITLQPLNPAFEPMFFTNQQIEELPITILGVVKEVRRSI